MTAICVIPARGGSTRIPRKNIREFYGKPMLAHAIETARLSGIFSRIVVSSDCPDIRAVAVGRGAAVHDRSEVMARDEVGTQEVMADILHDEFRYQFACCLYPCTPLLVPDDLRLAYHDLVAGAQLHYVVSVGYPPLADAGAFYFGHTWAFKALEPLIGVNTAMYHLPADRVCDINTEDDWQRAVALYGRLRGKN